MNKKGLPLLLFSNIYVTEMSRLAYEDSLAVSCPQHERKLWTVHDLTCVRSGFGLRIKAICVSYSYTCVELSEGKE